MHPELPIRPKHAKRRPGCEIVQHPSNATVNLPDDRFGTISTDNIFLAYEVVSRKHFPIRPAYSDGPGSDVGRFNNERAECELGVPKRTGPFKLTPKKSIITLGSLRIVAREVDDAATGYQAAPQQAWIHKFDKTAEVAFVNLLRAYF